MTHIAIIGAAGIMGSYTTRELAPACERVTAYDIDIPKLEQALGGISYQRADTLQRTVEDADVVLFCVPTDDVYCVIEKALNYCKKGALIAGQTSRKTPEAKAFDVHLLAYPESKLEMVTIHTLCDPSKTRARDETLGIIRHRASDETYARALALFSQLSDHVKEFKSVEEHDTATGYTQINTSRTLLSIASAFAQAGCFPWCNTHYHSSFDACKFSLAMRPASSAAHIYRGIQFGSPHGKEIVRTSLAVEHDLFRMIVGNEKRAYSDKICLAKKQVLGEQRQPILRDEDMSLFSQQGPAKENDDLSLMQWLVSYAELQRNISYDLKAATPLYRGLLCLIDRLCMTERFESALEAPFQYPSLRADDLVFDREITGWSEAILYNNKEGFDARHAAMRAKLDSEMLKQEVEKSKPFVALCRQRLEEARKAGVFHTGEQEHGKQQ